jgi:beta-mannosidase
MWAKSESLPIRVHITHAPTVAPKNLTATVEIFDAAFASQWRQTKPVSIAPGPSVATLDFGNFTIPDNFNDTFFFIVAELCDNNRQLVSRSVYWPRCLSRLGDESFRAKYRAALQPSLTLDKGPWLKPQAAVQPTKLDLSARKDGDRLVARVRNTGDKPAFMTRLDIEGVKRAFYATDNFFWLAPGEERELQMEILWREPARHDQATLVLSAWNAQPQRLPIAK